MSQRSAIVVTQEGSTFSHFLFKEIDVVSVRLLCAWIRVCVD